MASIQIHSESSMSHGVLLRVAAAAFASLMLVACGKPKEEKPAAAPTPPPPTKPAAISNAQLDSQIAEALGGNPSAPPASAGELASEAESILDQYPSKNAVELLNVPEVNGSLKVALTKLGQNPELQQYIAKTVELAAQVKGMDGTPGSARLDLDIRNYDRARSSRLLQAVLSEDPQRIVDFLVGEIGEATPELSYGGAERAANGVAIQPQTPPAPAPAAADSDSQPD